MYNHSTVNILPDESYMLYHDFIIQNKKYAEAWSLSKPVAPQDTSGFIQDITIINPLHAKFFRVSINIYLHFVSFLHIDTTQVVETLPQIRQEPTYST